MQLWLFAYLAEIEEWRSTCVQQRDLGVVINISGENPCCYLVVVVEVVECDLLFPSRILFFLIYSSLAFSVVFLSVKNQIDYFPVL